MPSLFGFAPGGVYLAVLVTEAAVRSYRTLSLLLAEASDLLSVALSLGSPPPDVIRHRVSVEPGLSPPPCGGAATGPSGAGDYLARAAAASKENKIRTT